MTITWWKQRVFSRAPLVFPSESDFQNPFHLQQSSLSGALKSGSGWFNLIVAKGRSESLELRLFESFLVFSNCLLLRDKRFRFSPMIVTASLNFRTRIAPLEVSIMSPKSFQSRRRVNRKNIRKTSEYLVSDLHALRTFIHRVSQRNFFSCSCHNWVTSMKHCQL